MKTVIPWPLQKNDIPSFLAKCWRYRSVKQFPFQIGEIERKKIGQQEYQNKREWSRPTRGSGTLRTCVFEGENWKYSLALETRAPLFRPHIYEAGFQGDYDAFTTDLVSAGAVFKFKT